MPHRRCLFGFQTQSGHFQILGTEIAKDIYNRSHDGSLFETKEICVGSNSPTANPVTMTFRRPYRQMVRTAVWVKIEQVSNREWKKSGDAKHREG